MEIPEPSNWKKQPMRGRYHRYHPSQRDDIDLEIGPEYPNGRCVARSRKRTRVLGKDTPFDDLRCKLPAVSGFRVCRIHGANPQNRGGRPPEKAMYSRYIKNQDVAARIEEYRADPAWANLQEEIAMLRGLLTVYIEKHPNDIEDEDVLRHITGVADQIGKLVEKRHKIEYGESYSLNVNSIAAYAARIADIINTEVDDEDARGRISEQLLTLLTGRPVVDYPVPAIVAPAFRDD